jgi:hypothetical protein
MQSQILNLVKNARAQAYGSDKNAAVELVYGSKPQNQCFMISNTTWSDEKGKQRVMIFALPAGLAALKNKQLNLNFDGTFKCTPKGFYQTCILGSRDHSSGKHIPCVFALLTTKTQEVYDIILHQIKVAVRECS